MDGGIVEVHRVEDDQQPPDHRFAKFGVAIEGGDCVRKPEKEPAVQLGCGFLPSVVPENHDASFGVLRIQKGACFGSQENC